jgi:hypothetical protein
MMPVVSILILPTRSLEHAAESTHAPMSAKEIIVLLPEIAKGITAAKKLPEYIVGVLE